MATMFEDDSHQHQLPPVVAGLPDSFNLTPGGTPGCFPPGNGGLPNSFPNFAWMPAALSDFNFCQFFPTPTDCTPTTDFNSNLFQRFATKPEKKPKTEMMMYGTPPAGPMKGQPGRRSKIDPDLPPGEQEKREKRRLRNKEAAARCRQRRIDLTQSLYEQVQTEKKSNLEKTAEMAKVRAELKRIVNVVLNHCVDHLPMGDKDIVANAVSLACRSIKEEQPEEPKRDTGSGEEMLPFPTSGEELTRPNYLSFSPTPSMMPNPFGMPPFSHFTPLESSSNMFGVLSHCSGLTPLSASASAIHDLPLN